MQLNGGLGERRTSQAHCSICEEIRGSPIGNLFHSMVDGCIGTDYLLEETDRFVVMPSIGAFVPGYLLIVPRLHLPSFAHLGPDCDAELELLIRRVGRKLVRLYARPCVVFEHGLAALGASGAGCVEHAHLHVVPVPPETDLATLIAAQLPVSASCGFEALRRQIANGRSYLSVRRGPNAWLYADAGAGVPSQYLRRALADVLGVGHMWHWVLHPEPQNVLATMRSYRAVRG